MGCGGSAGALPFENQKAVVHGDLMNSDTRTILSIMEICENEFVFKDTTPVNSLEAALTATYGGGMGTQNEGA